MTERGLRERMRRSPSQEAAERKPCPLVPRETTGNMGWQAWHAMDRCRKSCRGETNSRGLKNSVWRAPVLLPPCQTNMRWAWVLPEATASGSGTPELRGRHDLEAQKWDVESNRNNPAVRSLRCLAPPHGSLGRPMDHQSWKARRSKLCAIHV